MLSHPSLRSLLRTAPFIGEDSDEDTPLSPRLPRSTLSSHRSSPDSRPVRRLRGRTDDAGYGGPDGDVPGNFCSFFYRLVYLMAMFLVTLFLWSINPSFTAQNKYIADTIHVTQSNASANATLFGTRAKFSASCGVERGLWVPLKDDGKDGDEEREPYYTSYCPFVESGLSDCRFNGRRDFGYQNWRWQPYSCELPSVDAFEVLEALRNKKFAFIGDSIAGNQFKSLVCILYSQARVARSGVTTEVKRTLPASIRSLDKTITTIRFVRWNATIVWYRSNHLVDVNYVRAARGRGNYEDGDWVRQIRYDKPDPFWAREAASDDFVGILFIAHHHFIVPNGAIDLPEYRRALETVVRWVNTESPPGKGPAVFFQTPSARHWLGEQGTCKNQTQPILDPAFQSTAESLKIHIMDETIPPSVATIIRVTRLTDMRPDGHPSVWRMNADGVSEDCSHFCLPGVLDSVNEVVVANLLLKLNKDKPNSAT